MDGYRNQSYLRSRNNTEREGKVQALSPHYLRPEDQTAATFSHLLWYYDMLYRVPRIRGELKRGISMYLWHQDNMTGTK